MVAEAAPCSEARAALERENGKTRNDSAFSGEIQNLEAITVVLRSVEARD
jgi:hypothetical protein